MPQAPSANTPALPAHDFKGLADWVEVFKAGTHTDSLGRKASFSRADLEQMAGNHALGAAPAVIGHPTGTAPAYAWAAGYKIEGESLFAKFDQINPAFEAGVASGAYKNRSVSVFKDDTHGWRVRHVGWLGAVPPAIDGLAAVDFAAAAPEACFEFAAPGMPPGYSLVWGLENLAQMLRDLREQWIAKDGLEAADAALPRWRIDSAMEAGAQARAEFDAVREALAPTHSLFSTGELMTGFTQEQLDAAIAAAVAKATKDAQDAAAPNFAASQAELATLKSERQAERIGVQVTGWKAKGLVTPAEEPGLREFMAALEGGEATAFSFSAADKSAAQKTPAQFFADFMALRQPVVKLGQQSPADDGAGQADGNANDISDRARSYMKAQADKGLEVSVSEAVAYVSLKKA